MYEAAIAALTERVKLMHEAEWSPTPARKQAESIAADLVALADRLDGCGGVLFDIEQAHDAPDPAGIGPDGRPAPVTTWRLSYKGTIWGMRNLADTARRVAAELPDPRSRPAAPFAALVLLHLWYRCGRAMPTLYDDGEAVCELRQVLEGAGIVLSASRLRNVLSTALKEFDPRLVPDHLGDLL
jgi:hypothetical protein